MCVLVCGCLECLCCFAFNVELRWLVLNSFVVVLYLFYVVLVLFLCVELSFLLC